MAEEKTIVTPEEIAQEAAAMKLVEGLSRKDLETQYIHLAKMITEVAQEAEGMRTTIDVLTGNLESERALNKDIKRKKKGKKSKVPWYELEAALNPENYTKLPLPQKAYLLGHVDDVLIIEVPREASAAEITGLQRGLRDLGITSAALIVEAGINFMKLRQLSREEVKEAEALLEKIDNAPEAQETDEATAEEDGQAASTC